MKSIFEECGIDPNKPIRVQELYSSPDRAELDNIALCENNRIERRLLGGGNRMNKVFGILTKFLKENYNVEKKEG